MEDTATLSVVSSPSGADVLIDGTLVGTTPWSGELRLDIYHVVVRSDGYRPYETDVTLISVGHSYEVVAELEPEVARMGTVNVTADMPGGMIALRECVEGTCTMCSDGMGGFVACEPMEMGVTTPGSVDLPAGFYQITVVLDNYVATTQRVEVTADASMDVHIGVGRDLTGSWMCDESPRMREVVMIVRINLIAADGLESGQSLRIVGDTISSSGSDWSVTGTIGADGRIVDYTIESSRGTFVEHCTRT